MTILKRFVFKSPPCIRQSEELCNKKYLQIYNWTAWAVFVAVNAALFFNLNDVTYNRWKTTFYMALQRPVWAVLLAWLIYACINGHAGKSRQYVYRVCIKQSHRTNFKFTGILNKFMSLPIFQILSKLTYSMYLVHISLLMIDMSSERTLYYFTDYVGVRKSQRCCSYFVLLN